MDWKQVVEHVGEVVDVAGVAIMLLGLASALGRAGRTALRRAERVDWYRILRQDTGRAILLGLEFLVAGDIIRTVATNPNFTEVGVLAAIVEIRTFLSFTLEVELSGRWPWQGPADEPQTSRGGTP